MRRQRKGYLQARRSGFRKGGRVIRGRKDHSGTCNDSDHAATWAPRLDLDSLENITKSVYIQQMDSVCIVRPDGKSTVGSTKILRPSEKLKPFEPIDEYSIGASDKSANDAFVVNKLQVIDLINNIILEHYQHDKADQCKTPRFNIQKEISKGLSRRWILKCEFCDFVSSTFPLYEEASSSGPGAKPAAVNIGLQAGLLNSSIGNQQLTIIAGAANISAGAKSQRQKHSNKVSGEIEKLNTADMNERLRSVVEIQQAAGKNEPEKIDGQFDGRWGGTSGYGSQRKLGQGASMAVGVLREDVTAKHNIIGLSIANKLCWRGTWLRHRGIDASCPGGHDGECTATVSPDEPINERNLAQNIAKDIAASGVQVENLTTDGDAKGAEGFELGMQDIISPILRVTRLADSVHRGRSQMRAVKKAQFSKQMFPRHSKFTRKELQDLFSRDVKDRTSLIMKELFYKHAGDTKAIGEQLVHVVNDTVDCYSGDCKNCDMHTTMCNGRCKSNWWQGSMVLSSLGWKSGALTMDVQDRYFLTTLLEMKLSITALKEMKLNSNTNAVEGFNSSLGASLAKRVTHFRNAPGRAHGAAYRINNKVGNAVIKSMEHLGAPISRGGKAVHHLKAVQNATVYSIKYRKTPEVKRRELKGRKMQMRSYVQVRRAARKTDYSADQLEPKRVCRRSKKKSTEPSVPPGDHGYAQPSQMEGNKQEKLTSIRYVQQNCAIWVMCLVQYMRAWTVVSMKASLTCVIYTVRFKADVRCICA